tara:strand:- start:116 stop:412 length:297 start_codon:yes stop_codon:yes gene_type:complete
MGENQKIKLSKKQITTIVSIITLFLGGETFIGAKLIESKIQDFSRPEINPNFVGFFIEKTTKKMKFKHLDGEIYRPIIDKKTGRYFIILDNNQRVFCY